MQAPGTNFVRSSLAPYTLTLTGETDIESYSTQAAALVIPLISDVMILDPGGASRVVVLQVDPGTYTVVLGSDSADAPTSVILVAN